MPRLVTLTDGIVVATSHASEAIHDGQSHIRTHVRRPAARILSIENMPSARRIRIKRGTCPALTQIIRPLDRSDMAGVDVDLLAERDR